MVLRKYNMLELWQRTKQLLKNYAITNLWHAKFLVTNQNRLIALNNSLDEQRISE
jgi:hypothetical protein